MNVVFFLAFKTSISGTLRRGRGPRAVVAGRGAGGGERGHRRASSGRQTDGQSWQEGSGGGARALLLRLGLGEGGLEVGVRGGWGGAAGVGSGRRSQQQGSHWLGAGAGWCGRMKKNSRRKRSYCYQLKREA